MEPSHPRGILYSDRLPSVTPDGPKNHAELRARQVLGPKGDSDGTSPGRFLSSFDSGEVPFRAREGRAAARLDTHTNNSSRSREWRDRRYLRKSLLWTYSLNRRLRGCGKWMLGDGVQLRHRDGVGAGFGGVMRCGSVWICPTCSARILHERQVEIGRALDAHYEDRAAGRQVAFLTLTMRHRDGQRADELWNALGYAWGSVTGGKIWQRESAAHGLAGWVRVVEVTHGRNGWHIHIHALLLLDRADAAGMVTPAELNAWRLSIAGRWSRALERKGLSPALARAQDMQLVADSTDPLAAYFTKQTDTPSDELARELTQSAAKVGKTRSPWRILDGVIAGDADELRLWHEFEKASKGRRQMTWSRGLRDRLGLDEPLSDQDIAETEAGDASDTLCQIEGDSWKQTTWSSPHLLPYLLTLAEDLVQRHGRDVGAFELVRELGRMGIVAWLPYQLPPTADPDPPGAPPGREGT